MFSGDGSMDWRKSTASAGGECVEVARRPDGEVWLRDSKDPEGAVLTFTPGEWRCFLIGVRQGEFDLDPELVRS